jgi:hypothetical protein
MVGVSTFMHAARKMGGVVVSREVGSLIRQQLAFHNLINAIRPPSAGYGRYSR